MSGGVDSSVAALLLKEQGYLVSGLTMQLYRPENETGTMKGTCCGASAAQDAAEVCGILGIAHFSVNFEDLFHEKVIDYFAKEYTAGRTPNPCIACNHHLKWGAMLAWAREHGADHIATGHYAGVKQLENGRFALQKSKTAAKDQTYALYSLTQEMLSATLFPIGAYEKEEVRRIAERAGLPVAKKPDSQEICFVPDRDYARFLETEYGGVVPPEGNFVTKDGIVLGRHLGITHYTIGQRKGLGLSLGHPVFVSEIRPETNEVVVGEEEEVFTKTVYASDLSYMASEDLKEGHFLAKVRYNHAGQSAEVRKIGEDRIECRFTEPVRAATPGQALVLYDGDFVAGGGVITGAE